jgi:hypothetical protein
MIRVVQYIKAILGFMSDAAHLRALAITGALIANHYGLVAIDADTLEPILGLAISALGAAWIPTKQAPNDA